MLRREDRGGSPAARGFGRLVVATLLATPSSAAAQPPAAAVPVVAARVMTMEAASGQPFVGTVMAARTSDVGSAVDGRLMNLPIVEGQEVSENQPIAELLRGLLEIERAGAVAELDRRRQVLAELRSGSRAEEIEQARAAVAGFEARLAYAKDRLARFVRLAERGTSTADELQDARTELQATEAQLRGSRAALALAEAGPRPEQIAQAAAAAAVQEAEMQRIDDQLAKHTIRAPFTGWVTQLFTEKGQWVARGGLIARIAELATVEVEAQVPESSVAGLREGAEVRLEFDSAPEQAWIGTVARIVPQADLRSRSFPVHIRLANRLVDGVPLLKGGMLARAWLPVGATGNVTVVPKDALVLGGPKPVVFCVDSSTAGMGVVRAAEVSLGAAIGGHVAVRSGVEPGMVVVVRGNERLRPGMQVAFAPPAD
ncbi:MAG: efflux RND transporter periplasmic adaptor subunit [Planctomycetes bacterium]|nr:efflux RND transporter periplasmic adaptor subunit [Planctomycetota bacterium]